VPLIVKKPYFGYGADTFAIYFPQIDLIGRVSLLNDFDTIVEKPHNLFLSLLFNFGIFGFTGFVGLSILAMITLKNIYLSASLLGFVMAGIMNDSVVGVTYMFFVLMGCIDYRHSRE
jgi:O-antigen ligase